MELFQITNLMHNSFIILRYIYMLHYNPRHVSSSNMLIFRKTNCVIAASFIVTLCKRPCSKPVESGLQRTGIVWSV